MKFGVIGSDEKAAHSPSESIFREAFQVSNIKKIRRGRRGVQCNSDRLSSVERVHPSDPDDPRRNGQIDFEVPKYQKEVQNRCKGTNNPNNNFLVDILKGASYRLKANLDCHEKSKLCNM